MTEINIIMVLTIFICVMASGTVGAPGTKRIFFGVSIVKIIISRNIRNRRKKDTYFFLFFFA